MATKDYVKRGRAQKAPVTQKKVKNSPQLKKYWGAKIIVIIVCLMTATAYGIYHHKHKATQPADNEQTSAQTTNKNTTAPASAEVTPKAKPETVTSKTTKTDKTPEKPVTKISKEKALPALPQEQWNYIEQLETKVIPVKEKKQYDLPSQPFLMQCGAYRSRSQAERRQAQIALAGFESQIRVSQQKSTWYRVILGPYPRRRLAGQARAQMHLHGIEGCAVWQWDL